MECKIEHEKQVINGRRLTSRGVKKVSGEEFRSSWKGLLY